MARRSEHSRPELENLMLEQAHRIVGESGFEGLTARKLAESVGYTPGTIYNVFHSMDDLYLRLNGHTLDILYGVLNGPACNDPRQPSVANIKAMAAEYKEFCNQYKPYWLMLFTHRLPEGQAAPLWFTEKIERLFEPLERLLQDFYGPGEEQQHKMAARVLWSSVHGLCFLALTGKFRLVGDDTTINAMMDYLIENFVAGIKA